LNIGSVSDLSAVEWSADDYFIEISVNGTVMGTSKLLSVPFALVAKEVENVDYSQIDNTPTIPSDINQLDDTDNLLQGGFSGSFNDLTDIPTGLADGDDDTQLTETEVDAYVANNGYLTEEVDGSVTNEIELPSQSGNTGKILSTDGTSPAWVVDDVLTETEVDAYVANNGYLTSIADNSINGTDIALGGDVQGDIMYYNGTDWVRLPAGTSGQVLQTNGAGANPSWETVNSASSPVYGYAKITAPGTAISTETNFGKHTTASVSTTVSSNGISWNNTNKEFDITSTGVYEVMVTGSFYNNNNDVTFKIYVNVVEKNSVDILYVYSSTGNPFTINWIGSVTGGSSIKATLQGTDTSSFDSGSSFTIKKLD